MLNSWDWRDLPVWAKAQVEKAKEELTKMPVGDGPDRTMELRVRVKVLREILALPDKDPNRGMTIKEYDA